METHNQSMETKVQQPTEVKSKFSQRGEVVPWWLIALGGVIPTIITWVYFDLMASQPPTYQKVSFGIGKGIQVLVLVFAIAVYVRWELWRDFQRSGVSRPLHTSIGLIGMASGSAIGLIIFGTYYFVLLPGGWMENVAVEARSKVTSLGGGSEFGLIAIAIFYALFHSAFEEIYWRGFLFRALSKKVPWIAAVLVSGIGFMSHHVLVIGRYFGYQSYWTLICSVGVAVGGFLWAWSAQRTNSLLPGWLSHAFVDAAIFAVGLHLLFHSGS